MATATPPAAILAAVASALVRRGERLPNRPARARLHSFDYRHESSAAERSSGYGSARERLATIWIVGRAGFMRRQTRVADSPVGSVARSDRAAGRAPACSRHAQSFSSSEWGRHLGSAAPRPRALINQQSPSRYSRFDDGHPSPSPNREWMNLGTEGTRSQSRTLLEIRHPQPGRGSP